ncbi:MAG: SPASM domain-containing protein [Saprospiraceae bacterium]|nr:SPASM domain-containing protein [Saprospiraceae bacterium]
MPTIPLQDWKRMFGHLSLKKLANLFLVYSSYFLARVSGRPFHWGMPISLSFEPTTACNLRCPECPSGLRSFSRPTGNLKFDFFRTSIDQVSPYLCNLLFYFQGEPYINPEFLEMVSYAENKGIYTTTSTNGHFLTPENAQKTIESGLSRLIISIDGTTQDIYQQYRKEGSLDKVLAGTRQLVQARQQAGVQHPHIIIQYLVVGPNEHQIPEIYRLAKELGADEVRLKTAQVYEYENGNPLIPKNEKYSRYKILPSGRYRLKNKMLNHCWKMWHACVITWNGMVVPCCFDKDATERMGDLKLEGFKSIWKGESYKYFRTKLLKGRKEIEICKNCTEGTQVWLEA